MAPLPAHPVFVIVPGGAQSPAQYAAMMALLQQRGYPCVSALLPTTGTTSKATVEDDAHYIRDRMLLPVLDNEGHDVVMILHSYSGLPGSTAARGLSKTQRLAEGKSTGVIGQIYIACILNRGGEGTDVLTLFGGGLPPHTHSDEAMNLLRCDDPKPPLYHDVPEPMAEAAVRSYLCPNMTSFQSPIPPASWNEPGYFGRCAYIRTLNDAGVPTAIQDQLIAGTGIQWIVKDIETGHSPQLAAPEKLVSMLVGLTHNFSKPHDA